MVERLLSRVSFEYFWFQPRRVVKITQESTTLVEETLDPDDWESMRALAHRMLDEMLEYLKTVSDRPVSGCSTF